jgi:hypothetical protein
MPVTAIPWSMITITVMPVWIEPGIVSAVSVLKIPVSRWIKIRVIVWVKVGTVVSVAPVRVGVVAQVEVIH